MCHGGGGLFGLIPKLLGVGGGSSSPTPTTPTVDPAAERLKAEADATAKANEQLLTDARRKRAQKGLLSTDDTATGASVLAAGKPAASNPSTVLGSGGA